MSVERFARFISEQIRKERGLPLKEAKKDNIHDESHTLREFLDTEKLKHLEIDSGGGDKKPPRDDEGGKGGGGGEPEHHYPNSYVTQANSGHVEGDITGVHKSLADAKRFHKTYSRDDEDPQEDIAIHKTDHNGRITETHQYDWHKNRWFQPHTRNKGLRLTDYDKLDLSNPSHD